MDIKPIVLPIFHHTEESYNANKVGVTVPLEETEVRKVKFYSINAISPQEEEGKVYTSIHSNGTEFLCKLTPEEVDKKIIPLQYGENK